MSARKGSLVLIKVGNGATTETFSTIGGIMVSHMLLNQTLLEANTLESQDYRRLLSGAGLKFMRITGSGIFTDAASEELLRGYAFAGSSNNYRFIFASGAYCAGPFIISRYERRGDYDQEEIYALTLESAGIVTYSAS